MESLSVLSTNNECTLILCGAFNLLNISWYNDESGLSYFTSSSHCLAESFAFFKLFQLNHIPNLLGKFLSKSLKHQMLFKSLNLPPLELSYHPALEMVFSFQNEGPTIDVSNNYYNFHKVNHPALLNILESFNWAKTIKLLEVDSATCALYDALHYCILNFVPIIKYVKPKSPAWFTHKLKSIALA